MNWDRSHILLLLFLYTYPIGHTPFTHELSCCLWGNQISKGLFWDSLICSTDLYVYLHTDTTLIWFTIDKVCTFKVCSNIFRFKFISYWKLIFLVTIHSFFCILLKWFSTYSSLFFLSTWKLYTLIPLIIILHKHIPKLNLVINCCLENTKTLQYYLYLFHSDI